MPALPRLDLEHALSAAEDDFRALRGAHLVITGAAGAVGSWLVESAMQANARLALSLVITAVERRAGSFAARHPHLAVGPGLRVVTGDVRTVTLADGPTHLVHAASAVSPREHMADPDNVIDIIERGTARMLSLAAEARVARFLHISSGSVYDRSNGSGAPIAESHATLIEGATSAQRFGAAKRRAEASVERAAIPATIARLFTLVGPRIPLDGQFAVGQFLADALAGRAVRVSGDGTPVRTYLHMADLMVWCWAALVRGGAGRVYNVGANEPHTIGAVAEAVAGLPQPRCAVTIATAPQPDAKPDWYVPDTARARAELACDTRIGFDDALARTWSWLAPA